MAQKRIVKKSQHVFTILKANIPKIAKSKFKYSIFHKASINMRMRLSAVFHDIFSTDTYYCQFYNLKTNV